LLLVIAMLEVTDFFQKKAQECRSLAAGATKKKDREFWLGLAQRWEWLLQPGAAPDEEDQAPRFDRPIRQSQRLAKQFAKRRAA
jgi:hypothetical protein